MDPIPLAKLECRDATTSIEMRKAYTSHLDTILQLEHQFALEHDFDTFFCIVIYQV